MHRLGGAAGDSARGWPGRQPRAAGSWCQRAPAQGRGLPCIHSGTSLTLPLRHWGICFLGLGWVINKGVPIYYDYYIW